ncbi:MAG: DnaJ domain-containing protein [Anaerolineae bacterium]|nr:DnaJ domain-containing protein [Anaerolineae bacterium]
MLPRYYDLLSVRPDASAEDIQAARDTLLARYQPHAVLGDRDAVRLVKAIEEAAGTLADPTRRAAYDAALVAVTAPPPPSALPLVLPDAAPATPPAVTALPAPASPTPPPASSGSPPAPVVFLLFVLEWLAKHALMLRDGDVRRGELLAAAAGPSLPAPATTGVEVSAAGWTFTIHDAFHTAALAANGQRLTADGHWLLVRLAVKNSWPGYRALRSQDFALMAARRRDETASDVQMVSLATEATHAARLSLGMRATPAARHGLGFAADEEKETVVVFDLPRDATDAYLRLSPAAAIIDLSPISPLPALAEPEDSRLATIAPPVRPLEITHVQLAPGPGRSRTARVTARATPGALCHIRVQYAHGPSAARGLAPAVAGPDGAVAWSWRVSSRTRQGEWPVTVICGFNHALTTVVVGENDTTSSHV